MTRHILIIDDEEPLRKLLARLISLEGARVLEAGTLKQGFQLLQQHIIDIVLCDVKLPDGNGVDSIPEIKKMAPLTEVILLTAYGNIPDGVQSIKNGAFDYITKGNDNNRIIPLLHQALFRVAQQRSKAVVISRPDSSKGNFDRIIGTSQTITAAKQLAQKIAPKDATVLLLGETGTGKEVFASAIHQNSRRADKPFIAVNCSAFNKELLENELFGHTAEAYTGATKEKKGLLELADKGTLFLDELGEMHADLQAKLLRVLEDGSFMKLGDVKITQVNIRLIAATNKNLQTEMEQGRFREDLFYRINVFTIHLPALRERPTDISLLVQHFLHLFAGKEGKATPQVMPLAMHRMLNHTWNGNIRELKNVIERAWILSDGEVILPEHLPYEIQTSSSVASTGLTLSGVEKKHIEKVLIHTAGNKTRTAELLGIGLSTLYRKIEEYQIPMNH